MIFKNYLLVLATTLLTVSNAAPISNRIVHELKHASPEEINALASVLTNGINSVIHLSQLSTEDQSTTLKNYLVDMGNTVSSVAQAKGRVPPQLDGAYISLKNYANSYKVPTTKKTRSTYDPSQLNTHQHGVVGDSEGTDMYAPLANDINGLIQSKSAAGSIYKGFDFFDQIADGTGRFIGKVLAPITLGASKGIADFLTGPIVQTLTHGTYDTIAHLIGTPIDKALGVSELSPADQLAKNQAHASQLNNDQVANTNVNNKSQQN